MWTGEMVDSLSIYVDKFSIRKLHDSVERKLENESERTGLESELQQRREHFALLRWSQLSDLCFFMQQTHPVYLTKLLWNQPWFFLSFISSSPLVPEPWRCPFSLPHSFNLSIKVYWASASCLEWLYLWRFNREWHRIYLFLKRQIKKQTQIHERILRCGQGREGNKLMPW